MAVARHSSTHVEEIFSRLTWPRIMLTSSPLQPYQKKGARTLGRDERNIKIKTRAHVRTSNRSATETLAQGTTRAATAAASAGQLREYRVLCRTKVLLNICCSREGKRSPCSDSGKPLFSSTPSRVRNRPPASSRPPTMKEHPRCRISARADTISTWGYGTGRESEDTHTAR